MRPRLSGFATAALVVAATALATGCGGSDDPGTTAAGPTTTAGGSNIDLKATDFKFTPSDPTTKAGQVTFSVANDGQVPHSLEVEGPNGDEELSSDLSAGQSGVLTVDLSKPGKYEFYCPVGNHKELGMEGTITVQ